MFTSKAIIFEKCLQYETLVYPKIAYFGLQYSVVFDAYSSCDFHYILLLLLCFTTNEGPGGGGRGLT